MYEDGTFFKIINSRGVAKCFCGVIAVNTDTLAYHYSQCHQYLLPDRESLSKCFGDLDKFLCCYCEFHSNDFVISRFHLFSCHGERFKRDFQMGKINPIRKSWKTPIQIENSGKKHENNDMQAMDMNEALEKMNTTNLANIDGANSNQGQLTFNWLEIPSPHSRVFLQPPYFKHIFQLPLSTQG